MLPSFETVVAADICRGAMRLLLSHDLTALPEVTLPNGRRADLMAVSASGELTIVEIKSSREDFLTDRKWGDYLAFADRFLFAVAPGFPLELLPEAEGLILADRFSGEILRPPQRRPLESARRRSLLLRFARLGALRLQGLADPEAVAGRIPA